MKTKSLLRSLAVLMLVAVVPALLYSQAVNFAEINGRVTDNSGAVIPGAKVTVTQTSNGLVRSTTTNADGLYFFPSLPIGPYELHISAPKFREYAQKGIVLQVGERANIAAVLEVGNVAEVVEVLANAATVETHDNAISNVIDNERIMELPLDGRSVASLIMLTGAAANPTLTSNDLNSTKNFGNGQNNPGASQTVAVAGGQENSNNYLLDGSDNNDRFSNVNSPFPFPDAIQEFSVQTSGLSARYGVQAGATVNAVTKSGTNKYHGTAFEFIRNPIMNAKPVDFSALASGTRQDTIKRNQFGGTLGGPVVRDKLFFFLGYQGTRQSSSQLPITVTVPTAAAIQNGDFSVMMGASCANKTLKTNNGVTITGNKVDPTKFNPQAIALLKYIPASTDPNGCGRISYTYPFLWNDDQGVAKVDWNLSSKHSLFWRYFAIDSRVPLPFDQTNILPQSQLANQYSRYQTLAVGDTYTFASSMVNSVHLTAKRLAIHRGPASDMINPSTVGIDLSPAKASIPNGIVASISNYFAFGGGSSMPGYFINEVYQASDDVDMVHGKHQLSFGFNYMKFRLNYLSTFQSNGQFTFGGNFSGDNLVDFMLGFPSQFIQSNDEKENWRKTYLGLYAHDNIRLTNRLSVNLGLRWDPFFPSGDQSNRGSHFDINNFMNNVHSTVFPNAPAGLLFCGDKGIPCAYGYNQWKQFAPRVGLAWDPFGNGKSSVRASYGVFYDTPEMYYFDRYADNPPYGGTLQFTPNLAAGGNLTHPYTGQTNPPAFPLPFPKANDPTTFFPLNGVYINNALEYHPMYVQNWNLSVEHQLAKNWILSLTYLGSKTTHIWAAYEANPGMFQNTVATPSAALGGTACAAGAAPTTSNTNCRRALVIANPAQGMFFSNMTSLWDGGNATYNGFITSVKHPFGNNFTLLANYTWSHCISSQDFTGELTNSRPMLGVSPVTNPTPDAFNIDRGACGFDVRHVTNYSLVASVPKYSGLKGAILSNWQIAPILTYRTGVPFSVTTGVDTSRTGTTTSFKDRPNLTGDPFTGTCIFNGQTVQAGDRNCQLVKAAFTAPAAGSFGNLPRNSYYGPGAFTFDTSISRTLKLRENHQLQFRFESFNVLNHPNYGNPNGNMNSSDFGRITSQNGNPRTFQGAVKYMF